jgi:ABC-type transporter Mla MlaB component
MNTAMLTVLQTIPHRARKAFSSFGKIIPILAILNTQSTNIKASALMLALHLEKDTIIPFTMENYADGTQGTAPIFNESLNDALKMHLEAEKKISSNVMSIRLSSDGLIFRDSHSNQTGQTDAPSYQYTTDRLSGVYCQGVQYYDLNGIQYINNQGMATLIDVLKSLLEMGVEVQFVNVDEKIKAKIREMGLEKIINCSGKNLEKRVLL